MPFHDNVLNADGALIVGAGLAGLFCALKLAPRPVTLLSPKPLGFGASSAWAQGGVAAAVGPGDSAQAHARDTEIAGAGIVDEATAESVTAEAAARIEDLAGWGTPFDRDELGHFVLSREAAHSRNRVVRVEGDRAGYAIMQAMIARGVIGDFRAPDIIRCGFTPLFIDATDVAKAVDVLADIMQNALWDRPEYKTRAKVT